MSTDYITIPLSKGQETIIDSIDADLAQFKWHAIRSKNGYYAQRTIQSKVVKKHNIRLNRLIMSRIVDRELDPKEQADHINGDTLDNRRSNLRIATQSQNNMNGKRRKDNTTGYKGVSKRGNKWRAYIQVGYKQFHLGYFETEELAHRARCEAANELHGEFKRLE